MIRVGDRIKVKDQEIYGEVLRIHPTEVVIADEDAETWDEEREIWDNELCFKLTEVEEIE
tara:strand:- start:2450 stop:2629 length:180 start_codon:yes stop_codon:yes gene_type:complete